MSIVRGTSVRRKTRGSIHERVAEQLRRLEAERQAGCNHRWSRAKLAVCVDCGARP